MQKIDKTDTLKKILSGRRFTVDYFQREYCWGQKQIEQIVTNPAEGYWEKGMISVPLVDKTTYKKDKERFKYKKNA